MMKALGAEVVLVDQMPTSTPGQVSGEDLAWSKTWRNALCAIDLRFARISFCSQEMPARTTVEPQGAAMLAGRRITNPNHRIQGGGYAKPELAMLPREYLDGYIEVADEEAISAARRLAQEEGIFGGFSAGANVAAAMRLLQGACRGKTIAILIPDSELK